MGIFINGKRIDFKKEAKSETIEEFFDEEEKVWKYSDTSDEMKDLLDYVKKLYSEGLLDPEFLTI